MGICRLVGPQCWIGPGLLKRSSLRPFVAVFRKGLEGRGGELDERFLDYLFRLSLPLSLVIRPERGSARALPPFSKSVTAAM